MDGDTYSIGELARRTGLTVKVVRFYADSGIVPPAGRTAAGHRRFDGDAVARLALVRTLRELGLDLPTVRQVVDRQLPLAEVAAAHADALAVRIRALRLRRAVLLAVARRGSTPEEMDLMHRLARLSGDERRRLTDAFLDSVLGGDPALAGIRTSMTPELPDDAGPEQVEAWVELAGLSRDPDFRGRMGRMAEQFAADGGGSALRRDAVALARDAADPAVAAGVDPASPRAAAIVAEVAAEYARLVGGVDGPGLRGRLSARLETANDPRRERYLELLSRINGWPAGRPQAPALRWFSQALHAAGSAAVDVGRGR